MKTVTQRLSLLAAVRAKSRVGAPRTRYTLMIPTSFLGPISYMQLVKTAWTRTSSMLGRTAAIGDGKTRARSIMFQMTSLATRTWTSMARGAKLPVMDTRGSLVQRNQTGPLIAMGIGTISSPGVIRGWRTSRGDLHPSTTGVG